jgi:hypothetical protein
MERQIGLVHIEPGGRRRTRMWKVSNWKLRDEYLNASWKVRSRFLNSAAAESAEVAALDLV